MAQVDKVLETLLRWMLATEPEDRPDMPAVIGHDWCRKRFPRLSSSNIKSMSDFNLGPGKQFLLHLMAATLFYLLRYL